MIGGTGGFAGLYALAGYEDPVLASTIDGVGTKVLVAREVGRYDTLGADIVNHCANDVLATGADPLFFLDYVATGQARPRGRRGGRPGGCGGMRGARHRVRWAARRPRCPASTAAGDFDVVGVCTGACERADVVTGEKTYVPGTP